VSLRMPAKAAHYPFIINNLSTKPLHFKELQYFSVTEPKREIGCRIGRPLLAFPGYTLVETRGPQTLKRRWKPEPKESVPICSSAPCLS
jgi:hypothetical protein